MLDFFANNKIDVTETDNYTKLVQKGDYCLAKPGEMYIAFLKKGSGIINLESQSGVFSIKWFDPRNGGNLQTGSLKNVKVGKTLEINGAPSDPDKDWVVLLSGK